MASSSTVSNKCAAEEQCKKNAIIKCDGCSARFCSNHFPIHRQELETRLELICADRDQFHHQLKQQTKDPTELLTQIDRWEQQTLADVKRTANEARDRIPQLAATNQSNPQFDQFSQELKRRKENEDYFEEDIERLKQQLKQIQIQSRQLSTVDIRYTPIDWRTIIRIDSQKQKEIPIRPFFRDTTLIALEHQQILNQFCGRLEQQWQLIYRGTRDGFGEGIFTSRCANQGPTITVILVDKYLFGGYTSISWKHSESVWDRDPTAFLFTLINPHQIPPTKYPIQTTGDNAIRSNVKFGPTFGHYDICVHPNSNESWSSNSTFPRNYCDTTRMGFKTFTGTQKFQTSEIEVYKQVSLES